MDGTGGGRNRGYPGGNFAGYTALRQAVLAGENGKQRRRLGEWSEPASVVVQARPPEPVISRIDPAPRIFICWQAQDQQGHQVQIGDRIFPEQYGTEKQWRCPVYLEDGCYTVKVRVQNVFGRWSLWAGAQAVIQNKESGKIFLTGRAVGWEILLSWSFVGDFAGFLIKKDGKVIAETKETAFCDRLYCTKHQYEIIGQTKNGYYVSSGVRAEIFRCLAQQYPA